MKLTEPEILAEIKTFREGIQETLPDFSPILIAFTYDHTQDKFGKLILPDPILDLFFKHNQIQKTAELLKVMSENLLKESNQRIIGVLSISEGHLNDEAKPVIIFSYQSMHTGCLLPYYLIDNKLVSTEIDAPFSGHYMGHIGRALAQVT